MAFVLGLLDVGMGVDFLVAFFAVAEAAVAEMTLFFLL
jgi:hypothetical protein